MRLHAPAGIELPASPRLLDATAIDEIAVGQEGFVRVRESDWLLLA